MQSKKQKAYQLSYRKQLIQLAKFYRVVEVKNYFVPKLLYNQANCYRSYRRTCE